MDVENAGPCRCCCCAPECVACVPYADLRTMLKPQTEYQERYKKEIVSNTCAMNNQSISAGVTSKGKPECQTKEYDVPDGNLPRFKGESTARSSYVPQPPISKLKSFKPSTRMNPPKLLDPEKMEELSYSNWSHSPMPLELARKTAPAIPPWISEMLQPMQYQTRYDLTSTYQAHYCGTQTKPRRICYRDPDNQHEGENSSANQTRSTAENQSSDGIRDPTCLSNYVNSLLYRTTTGSTYLPPSVFGEPLCHSNRLQ